jgi:hypothetical protein
MGLVSKSAGSEQPHLAAAEPNEPAQSGLQQAVDIIKANGHGIDRGLLCVRERRRALTGSRLPAAALS